MVLQFAVVDLGTLGLVNLWQWSRIIRVKIQKGYWLPTTSCFSAGKWSIYPPHAFTALMNFKTHLMSQKTNSCVFFSSDLIFNSFSRSVVTCRNCFPVVMWSMKARRNQFLFPVSGDLVPFVLLMAIVVSTFYLHSWNSKHWQ